MKTNNTLATIIKVLAVLAMLHAAYAFFKYNVFAWHIPVIAATLWKLGKTMQNPSNTK